MKGVGRSKHSGTVIKKSSSSSSSPSSSPSSSSSSSSKRSESSDNSSSETISPKTAKKESNGFDVFEFDEYDDISSSSRIIRNGVSWNLMKSGNKSNNKSSSGSRRRRRCEIPADDEDDDDDDADLPLSVLRKKFRSDKPTIKLQPKNGHKKEQNKKKSETKSSFYSNSKTNEKSHREVGARSKAKKIPIKPGRSTEKQLLREKIKNMLLAADWTIDYKPRKNRNYSDAVYISPAGTGYWSMVKAYDAFQKDDEGNSNDSFPEEILGKLTRQTQKKIEREMIYKRKSDTNEDESVRKNRKLGRCTLLVRGSDNSENDGFVANSGKRTLLSWLIDSGVVRVNEHVKYKTRVMQKGCITKDGIRCGCCSEILTGLKFERHSGSELGQPFKNIVLDSGKTLTECQIDAWNKQGELERTGFYSVDVVGDDPNDDTCGVCGDGGDLICCDGCPSTFHQTCLNIQILPQGDWHCPNCSCKYCELAGGDCSEIGGKSEDKLLICCFCQKKYHESCRPEIDVKPIESSYPNLSFCEHKCHELYSQLQKLVGVKHELDSGFSWTLIHRSDLLNDASSVQLPQQVECNSMLAVAMSVMDECFMPFTDTRSGTNLIRNVVFNCGSNLSRINYSRFFTAILEREDEVICAACIRVHGIQLAEMPFIGTRHIYRRKGMCRRLLSAVESALFSLQIEKLVIPAVAEHMHTWTDAFGFHPLEESHKQELKSMNLVVFPRTDMLQKPLVKQHNPPNAEPKDKNTQVDDYRALLEKSELISSDEKDCSEKTATRESAPRFLDVSCEPKPSVSVDEESSLQEQVGNIEDENMVQNGNVTNPIPTQDPNVQELIGMQNGDSPVSLEKPSVEFSERKEGSRETEKPSAEFSEQKEGSRETEKPSAEFSERKEGSSETEKPSAEFWGSSENEKPSAEISERKEGSCETEKPSAELSERKEGSSHETEKPSAEFSERKEGSSETEKPSAEFSERKEGSCETQKPSAEFSERKEGSSETENPSADFSERKEGSSETEKPSAEFSERKEGSRETEKPSAGFSERKEGSSETEKPSAEFSERKEGSCETEKPSAEFTERKEGSHETEKPSAEFSERKEGSHETEKLSAEFSERKEGTEKPSAEFSERKEGSHDTEKLSAEFSERKEGTEKPSAEFSERKEGSHETEKLSAEFSERKEGTEKPSAEFSERKESSHETEKPSAEFSERKEGSHETEK